MARSSNRSSLLLSTAIAATLAVAATVWLCQPTGASPLPLGGATGSVLAVEAPAAAAGSDADGERTVAARTSGCWTAAAGSRFTFRVDDQLELAVHSPEGGVQQGAVLHARCEVTTLVLDRRHGETLVEQRITGLQFLGADSRPITGDAAQESYVAATVEPVLVRMATTGQILGYGFAAELDGDQRNFLRGTLGLFAFEAPGAASSWTSFATDSTGDFEARYEAVPATVADALVVQRRRTRYTKVTGQKELPQHELSGQAEAQFALSRGWLDAVRLDERMTMALSILDLRTLVHRVATIDCTSADVAALPTDLAAAWTRAEAPASSAGERLGSRAEADERAAWRQRLQATSLGQILADLQRLLAAADQDNEAVDACFQQLQWLLRLDDRAVDALQEQLAARQLGDRVAQVAIGALGAANTDRAQQSLVALRNEPALGDELRHSATVSCLQLGKPGTVLFADLLRDAEGDSAQAQSSLLVLGALAPRAEGEGGSAPLTTLLAMEERAEARGQLRTWLLAVGNSRTPAAEPVALRLLGHADADVRAAACVALGRQSSAQALDALCVRGLGDASPAVRHEAVIALSRRSEPAARTALQQVADGDADVSVRDRARRVLGGS